VRRYDPLKAPNPQEWLALDELKRLSLVREYHRRARVRLPNRDIHAAIHETVENQVALGDEIPVCRTLERLIREGLDRHEAIHAIGSVLVGYLFDVLKDEGSPVDFNAEYFEELEQLTAQSWLAAFEEP
jgi:hypothetical protein